MELFGGIMTDKTILDNDEMKNICNRGVEAFKEKYFCKITVLECDFKVEYYKQHPYGIPEKCGRLKVGQEFISKCRWDPPEGFCIWAWRDLIPSIQTYHEGRINPSIACCTDGLRPVTFKIEGIEVNELS
jgi:uncharacterized repeat protein (TIGR04076 family)